MIKKTKYLKFPLEFKVDKMLSDLALILEEKSVPHYNTNGYSGEWKVISLYAQGGDDKNIFALSTSDAAVEETAILKECKYLKEVIDSFQCPILSARLLKLGAAAKINPHRDHDLGYADGNFRLHIPIITNPDVEFILDGDQLRMLPGECWYTDVNYVHSVHNAGSSERVHLVIDGERNAWSDEMFFSLAPPESFESQFQQFESAEMIQQTIEQLKHLNEPAALQIIEELTQKLKHMQA